MTKQASNSCLPGVRGVLIPSWCPGSLSCFLPFVEVLSLFTFSLSPHENNGFFQTLPKLDILKVLGRQLPILGTITWKKGPTNTGTSISNAYWSEVSTWNENDQDTAAGDKTDNDSFSWIPLQLLSKPRLLLLHIRGLQVPSQQP